MTSSSSVHLISEFVRKLYDLLEEQDNKDLVSWSVSGDSFLITDRSEFSKKVLPKYFKHSNFSSFVRQLNKYGFHKLKADDKSTISEVLEDKGCEFFHENFLKGKPQSMESIKKKQAKPKQTVASKQEHIRSGAGPPGQTEVAGQMQNRYSLQVACLSNKFEQMENEFMALKKTVCMQDKLIQSLAHFVMSNSSERTKAFPQLHNQASEKSSISSSRPSSLDSIWYEDLRPHSASETPSSNMTDFSSMTCATDRYDRDNFPTASNDNNWIDSDAIGINQKKLTTVWQIPPRVLIVEDDIICQKLSAKILQIHGCALDIVNNGIEAINRMNFERYDIVLMDIVMPTLDGIAATCQIRQFDKNTPIISMTANITENDCLTYLATGMNDILPKPISKDSLMNILDRHCSHLKVIKKQLFARPTSLCLSTSGTSMGQQSNSIDTTVYFPKNIHRMHDSTERGDSDAIGQPKKRLRF